MPKREGIQWLIKGEAKQFKIPMIMGILNITPDSFSDGGQYASPDLAIDHAMDMVEQGADIIDIGGESTRPGAPPVTEEEELDRVIPIIRNLSSKSEVLISVDTQKSGVARAALESGAHIINDVSAGIADEAMLSTVAETGAVYVMMHMQGTPQTMQDAPVYENVITEIKEYFKNRIQEAERQGVKISNIVLDPGIGFGKQLDHNLKIIAQMKAFCALGHPILLGASRKSFIGSIDGSEVAARMGGSLAAVLAAFQQGVQIFRVHDVHETRQALHIFTAIQSHLD
ncbi:MAG: dihydropteroate synthase [Candidatus Marinimicrobia bacterium]|nr:dihydropteroate synthase [Candidatus Neomarinimicrobiota bacterium]MCF7851209.1 dihydropteroate synthase [Candidatus Neomarinimicrobiota bacterium]MCF7904133.1 dihydropteroate synthase [Candidatus Neomarinimicrobiota bacterium]